MNDTLHYNLRYSYKDGAHSPLQPKVRDTLHYNLRYSQKDDAHSITIKCTVIMVSDALHYNLMYSQKGERYYPLQSNVQP